MSFTLHTLYYIYISVGKLSIRVAKLHTEMFVSVKHPISGVYNFDR